jgi:large subunit ribosomal protein L13
MEHKINAEGKILGRLATEIAVKLRGKDSAAFNPARMSMNSVVVYNVDKIRVTGNKMEQKIYRRHSGYLGGLREETLKDRLVRDSRLALAGAVEGMLPKNRSRKNVMKRLVLIKGTE